MSKARGKAPGKAPGKSGRRPSGKKAAQVGAGPGRVRLQRYLAQSGVAARRKAELFITDGRVEVNGVVVTELGTTVDPNVDRVSVDGEAVHPEEHFYVLFNKPKGSITAVSDPEGRPVVMEWLPNLPVSVKPVGRLDFYTEGVLLLTNDGELSAALQSSKRHVPKTYHAKFRGRVQDRHIELLRRGVRLDDGTVTRPAEVDRLSAKSSHDWLVITLIEGKNRQIHRMAEALGLQITKLQRVAFGPLTFHGLRVGDARELNQAELASLRQAAGLSGGQAVARGKWKSRREDTELARRARSRERQKAAELAGEVVAPRPERKPERRPERKPERRPERKPERKPAGRGGAGKVKGSERGGRRGSGTGSGRGTGTGSGNRRKPGTRRR